MTVALLIATVSCARQAQPNPPLESPLIPGEHTFTKEYDGIPREYHVHVPVSYDPSSPAPLVVVLHGGGGKWASAQKGSGMDTVADEHGFIVVYPNSGQEGSWNVGPRARESRQSDVDDVSFIAALIEEVSSQASIDPKRIYATGLSNGGMMTYRLGCDLSETFAAIAPVETALMFHPCEPTSPVSVMHFHGTADNVIPYNGGVSDPSVPGLFASEDDTRSAEESVQFWADYNHCTSAIETTYQKGEVTCVTRTECAGNTEVTLCTITGGGHVWPGGSYELDQQWYQNIVGHITPDISAAEAAWDFFDKHPRE